MNLLLIKSRADGWKQPTPAQAEAGNYKKPRVRWQGLEIAIENLAGTVREGKGWRTEMKYDYGYVCRSEAVDGDEVDVYLGPDLDAADTVYVVHQRKYGDWKSYDEDKAMIGFASEEAARDAYLAHYDDPRFLGPITAMPVEEFVRKVKATKEKPAMIKAIVLFMKGGKPGAPGLHKITVTDKNGRQVDQWVKAPHAKYDNRQMMLDFGDPYESIETRPGTTEAQVDAGKAALEDLKKHILGFRVGGKSTASLLGVRLYRGLSVSGEVNLVKKRIQSNADLAALAQVYRDPRFETFRVFYMRGDEVVGETAYSSRLPGSVQLKEDFTDMIAGDKDRFSADGFYILHNHPSGSSDPSKPDLLLTKRIAESVDGFRGHVVIDHNEYSVIDQDGRHKTVKAPELEGVDFTSNPSLDHDLLGSKITQPQDAAMFAKAMQKRGELGRPVLVMTQGFLAQASVIASFPMDALPGARDRKRLDGARAWLRAVGRKTGAGSHTFVVVSDADLEKERDKFAALIESGIATDVVSASGASLRQAGVSPRSSVSTWFANKGAERIVRGGEMAKSMPDFGTPLL